MISNLDAVSRTGETLSSQIGTAILIKNYLPPLLPKRRPIPMPRPASMPPPVPIPRPNPLPVNPLCSDTFAFPACAYISTFILFHCFFNCTGDPKKHLYGSCRKRFHSIGATISSNNGFGSFGDDKLGRLDAGTNRLGRHFHYSKTSKLISSVSTIKKYAHLPNRGSMCESRS